MAGVDYASDAPVDPDTFVVYPRVFRYDPSEPDGADKYKELPNVRCLSVEFFEGPRPPEARFKYEFDSPYAEDGDPSTFEEVVPIDSAGPHVVKQDDRIVVRVYDYNGAWVLMFDGFAQVPQGNASASQEVVTFAALGTPCREWDEPLPGAVCRACDDPQTGKDSPTMRVVRFNPEGKPNATPNGYDHGGSGRGEDSHGWTGQFPTFFDEQVVRTVDYRRWWTLGMAFRYAVFSRQVNKVVVDKWMDFGDPTAYDAILESREPNPEGGAINPDDPSTYTDKPIRVQDLDVTTNYWPDAAAAIMEPHGFDFRFLLDADHDTGDPKWHLKVYRKDATTPLKRVYLQAGADDGSTQPLDVTKTNAGELVLQRDNQQVRNCYTADSALTRYEVGVWLRPGFNVDPTDADPANLPKWVIGNDNFDPVKYRVFHANDAGDGVWDFDASAMTFTPPDFKALFGPDDADGNPSYVVRRRPGEGKLLTLDKDGDRLPAELYVCANFAGAEYGLMDWLQHGDFQRVTKGSWEMLDDRLGIRLTHPDLENWTISEPPAFGSGKPFTGGVCRVVTCQAHPGAGGEATTKRFWFMLVCTITGDTGLDVKAERRAASPTTYKLRKREDERGWFAKEVRDTSSPNATDTDADKIRDDTKDCQARMDALRKARELGSVAGSVTVPRFTLAYEIGDRIEKVVGRDATLRQNLGTPAGEGPTYPAVVAVRWDFDQKQNTVLSLSDRRSDPPPERRR